MTLPEAALILGTSAANLRQAIARGSLRARKIGRDWHVDSEEVVRYRNENRRAVMIAAPPLPVRNPMAEYNPAPKSGKR